MLLTLFAIGSFWFWALLVVHFCVLLALIEYEKVGWATTTMVATFAALYFFGDFNIVSAVIHNPVTAAIMLGGYFVAGTVWSVVKWWFFVRNIRDEYDELKKKFLARKGVDGTVVPENLRAAWKEELSNSYRYSSRDRRVSFANGVIPKAGDHKARISCWMCYWPWSAVWTLLNDPVKRAWKQIYLQIQGLLQSISNRAFRGVEDDLKEPPAAPPSATDPQGDSDTTVQPRGVRRGGAAAAD